MSILFVDNPAIQTLNKNYRNIDQATDVLSFAQRDGEYSEICSDILGDIVISVEMALSQSEKQDSDLESEIFFLLIHAILHLIGYDHEKSKKDEVIMRKKESELVEVLKQEMIY